MMRNKQLGFTLVEMIYLIIVCGGIYGYVCNIIAIVHAVSDPAATVSTLSVMTLFRLVGVIVAPLGAILGYC